MRSPPPPPFGGGWGPPPLQAPKLSNTPRGHTLAGGGPRGSGTRQCVLQGDVLQPAMVQESTTRLRSRLGFRVYSGATGRIEFGRGRNDLGRVGPTAHGQRRATRGSIGYGSTAPAPKAIVQKIVQRIMRGGGESGNVTAHRHMTATLPRMSVTHSGGVPNTARVIWQGGVLALLMGVRDATSHGQQMALSLEMLSMSSDQLEWLDAAISTASKSIGHGPYEQWQRPRRTTGQTLVICKAGMSTRKVECDW